MTFSTVLTYLTRALLLTAEQLLWLLGPLLPFALVMHIVSTVIQCRAALLCGPRVHLWLTLPGVVVHKLGLSSAYNSQRSLMLWPSPTPCSWS